jgi:hypothetical protein
MIPRSEIEKLRDEWNAEAAEERKEFPTDTDWILMKSYAGQLDSLLARYPAEKPKDAEEFLVPRITGIKP